MTSVPQVEGPPAVIVSTTSAMLARGGGSLIFTSTFVGHAIGMPGMAAYGAAKAAVLSLVKGLSKTYGSLEVFAGVDLAIDKSSRVVVLGYNGAGKTTLLKLLAGVERTDGEGGVVTGHGLKIGYFAQHQLDELRPAESAYAHVRDLMPDVPESKARAAAARLGRDEVKRVVTGTLAEPRPDVTLGAAVPYLAVHDGDGVGDLQKFETVGGNTGDGHQALSSEGVVVSVSASSAAPSGRPSSSGSPRWARSGPGGGPVRRRCSAPSTGSPRTTGCTTAPPRPG